MTNRNGQMSTGGSPATPSAPVSDDLWNALSRARRTACAQHTAWADHCKHLHQTADSESAVAS